MREKLKLYITENKTYNAASIATATKLPEWITVKCYMFIGKVHCISRIGMIPQQTHNA